jgi:hypothetical protein
LTAQGDTSAGPVTRNTFSGEGLSFDEKVFQDDRDYYKF